MASNLAGGYLSVRLHVTSTDVVATRPLSALKQLRQGSGPLRNAIIGREWSAQFHPPIYQEVDANGVRFLDSYDKLAARWKLNWGQYDAIKTALDNTLSLIQDPPGTGKTWVIAALIWLCVIAGKKVLACAVSNKAVDDMRKLMAAMPPWFYPHLKRFPVVRLHLPRSERQHVTELGLRAQATNIDRIGEELDAAQSSHLENLAKVYRAQCFREEHWDMPEYSLAQAIVMLARIDKWKYENRVHPDAVCKDFRRILALYHTGETVNKPDQALFRVQYKIMVHRVFDHCPIVAATCNNSGNADLMSAYCPNVRLHKQQRLKQSYQSATISTPSRSSW